jgi:hypothetical protein
MAEVVSMVTAIAQVLLQIYEKRGELSESVRRALNRIKNVKDMQKISEIVEQECTRDEVDRVKRDIELVKESLSSLGGFAELPLLVGLVKDLPDVPYAELWEKLETTFKNLLRSLGIPELELGSLPFEIPGSADLSLCINVKRGFYAKAIDIPCDIWVEGYFLYIDLEPVYEDEGKYPVGLTLDLIKEVVTKTLDILKQEYESVVKRRQTEAETVQKMLDILIKATSEA